MVCALARLLKRTLLPPARCDAVMRWTPSANTCIKYDRTSSGELADQVVAVRTSSSVRSLLDFLRWRATGAAFSRSSRSGIEQRYGEVVQRRQRLRLHHAGGRRQGRVLAFLGDPGGRLQKPQGKRQGRVQYRRKMHEPVLAAVLRR